MGRHRKNIKPDGNNMNPGHMGNPGGEFNMNDFGKFINNVDLNQLMGQLSSMMGGPQGPQGGFQGGPPGGFQQNPQGGFVGGFQPPPKQPPKDPRMQLMQALKPFLSRRRAIMLDNIGQLYSIFNIVKSINKR